MSTQSTRKERLSQVRAREFWLKRRFVYFAIDMGLGKTGICINTINQLGLRTLVVAPLKVAYNTWPDEIAAWGMSDVMSIDILHGPQKDAVFAKGAQVHVINYEGLPWLYNKLFKMFKAGKTIPYKVLILDESTYVKDPESRRFGYICALRDLFSYVALLSGTPSPNSLLDLWAQYYILDKGKTLGNDYRVYRQRFFEQDAYQKYRWKIKFGAETAIRRAIAKSTFRLQSSDYIDIPKRNFNNISLELPSKEAAMYKSFQKDFVLMLDKTKVESLNQASLSSKLRQFVQGAIYENRDDGKRITHYLHDIKVRALRELCDINKGKNILCAIQFQFETELIRKAFPNAPAITGATKTADANRFISEWNEKKIPLLIVHPKSVGRGLNLQAGGHITIWFAPTYSLDDYQQLNKRLHRPGQVETVIIHHLVLRGTIDEIVYRALTEKATTQERLLDYLREETNKWLKTCTITL